MTKSKKVVEESIEPIEEVEEVEEVELTNNEFNEKVFADIKKLEDKIVVLRETLKPVEEVKNASLAECNKIAQKNNEAIRKMRNVRRG